MYQMFAGNLEEGQVIVMNDKTFTLLEDAYSDGTNVILYVIAPTQGAQAQQIFFQDGDYATVEDD